MKIYILLLLVLVSGSSTVAMDLSRRGASVFDFVGSSDEESDHDQGQRNYLSMIQQATFQDLWRAIEKDNVKKFQIDLRNLGDINFRGNYQRTLVHLAAECRHGQKFLRIMQVYGPDYNAVDSDGNTALMSAVVGGHWSNTEFLLAQTDTSIKNEEEYTVYDLIPSYQQDKTLRNILLTYQQKEMQKELEASKSRVSALRAAVADLSTRTHKRKRDRDEVESLVCYVCCATGKGDEGKRSLKVTDNPCIGAVHEDSYLCRICIEKSTRCPMCSEQFKDEESILWQKLKAGKIKKKKKKKKTESHSDEDSEEGRFVKRHKPLGNGSDSDDELLLV